MSLKYSGSKKDGRKKVLDRKLKKVGGKRWLKRGKGMFRNKEKNGEREKELNWTHKTWNINYLLRGLEGGILAKAILVRRLCSVCFN